MNKHFFRCVFILILAVSLLASPLPAPAASGEEVLTDLTGLSGMPQAPSIEAPSAILIEAKSGAILYAKNADERHYPASITKIMTALLTIENCSLDETVTFSYRATHELEENSSGIARTEGEEMSVRDCLYGLLIASANEVAQALAEHVSGTIEDFAVLMNQRAAELGCTNTHFANPSGLNSPEHYTSAHDMALIMREAVKNPTFLEVDSTTHYTIPATNKHSEPLVISMSHQLLLNGANHYEYAVAGKTGYTSLAGYTLVTYAVKDDMELICVIMDGPTSESRYTSTRALFDYGFNNFQMIQLSQYSSGAPLETDGDSGQYLGSNILSLTTTDEDWLVLPSSLSFSSLDTQVSWGGENGESALASITYSYQGTPVGTATLTVNPDADSAFPFNGASFNGQRRGSISVWTLALYGGIGAGLVLLILLLVILARRSRRKRTVSPGASRRRSRSRRRR